MLDHLTTDRDVHRPPPQLVSFFLAAFGLTWALQLPAVLVVEGVISGPMERYLLPLGLGAFGPLLAAVLVSSRTDGRSAVRALFRPLGTWRVGVRWYVIALGLPGAILAAGMAIYNMVGDGPHAAVFYPPAGPERLLAMIVFSVGEEVGFRGFALPRLQRRFGPLVASVILGLLWTAWHIPMFLVAGVTPGVFAVMIVFLVCGSILFTWIYNHTRQSLLLAVIAHMGAHLNNSHLALPADVVPVVVHTMGYVVVAVALVFLDRPAWRLSHGASAPSARAAVRKVGAKPASG